MEQKDEREEKKEKMKEKKKAKKDAREKIKNDPSPLSKDRIKEQLNKDRNNQTFKKGR